MADPTVEKEASRDLNGSNAHPDVMQHEVPRPTAVSFFRGTLFQTLVVGLASFLAPGMYAALSATGAGGLANVRTGGRQWVLTDVCLWQVEIGNASVAIAYALIVPSALVSSESISAVGDHVRTGHD